MLEFVHPNSKNGVSSHEMARSLGITQKSAWFLLHRSGRPCRRAPSPSSTAKLRSTRPSSAARPATCTRPSIGLASEYDHKVVDHAEKYVDGQVHVNGVENFWSLLKRGLHGTYVSVQPWDLFRYIDERVFTYNERDLTDLDRFLVVLGTVAGRRLTYKALRGPRITSLSDCCCGGMPGQ
jgi:hypothetical protein